MPDLPPIASAISSILFILLIITFVYALASRFVSDQTLYDLTLLPVGDEKKITYYIEPSPSPTEKIPFPTVFSAPECYVTFVVPAYNEAKRIKPMLDDTVAYLNKRHQENQEFTWEIIVVDDGSKDETANIVLGYARQFPQIRLLKQPHNMGKGAAVQAGSLHSRGELILMVDADGATKIDEFGELEKKIIELKRTNKESIVVGSRAHLEGADKANRTPLRKFLGSAFHFLILLAGVRGIKDTQCGFKLFTREAARWLFPNQHVQRWCFDPELLVIGKSRGMNIAEVPVEWNEIEGSKIKIRSMIKMAIDLIRIAVYHRVGLWTIKMKSDTPIEEFEP